MANPNIPRNALFLKQFGGEILTEFEQNNVFKNRHFVRQISNGKSAQFPLIGMVGSSMHTPGAWIVGATVPHAEVVLTIDGLCVAPLFVADIDTLMNHYDVRGPYSLRVYEVTSGKEIWCDRLPAGGQATPMTYQAATDDSISSSWPGGHGSTNTKAGDAVIAYALPK